MTNALSFIHDAEVFIGGVFLVALICIGGFNVCEAVLDVIERYGKGRASRGERKR